MMDEGYTALAAELNGAQIKTLVEAHNKAYKRIRELEQFARDIAAKLDIEYTPPVSKGECVYLVALEGMKARLAEAERQNKRLFDTINHANNDCLGAAECYVCGAEARAAQLEAALQNIRMRADRHLRLRELDGHRVEAGIQYMFDTATAALSPEQKEGGKE